MTRFFDNENQNFEIRKNDFSHKQWRRQPNVPSILFQSRAAKKLRVRGYHPRGRFTICEVSEDDLVVEHSVRTNVKRTMQSTS